MRGLLGACWSGALEAVCGRRGALGTGGGGELHVHVYELARLMMLSPSLPL